MTSEPNKFQAAYRIPCPPELLAGYRLRLLRLLQEEPLFAWYDSNDYYRDKALSDKPYYHSFGLLAGIGARRSLRVQAGHAIEALQQMREEKPSWLLGYLGYDLKNELEALQSKNPDRLHMPDLFFFEPEILLAVKDGELSIHADTEAEAKAFLNRLQESVPFQPANDGQPSISLQARTPKDTYLAHVQLIREHILEGDVYELNYCQEFYAEEAEIDPFHTFYQVSQSSPQPFSAFIRMEDQFVLSASMERFLKKEGSRLVSQPIKGTIRRGADALEDDMLGKQLQQDPKERAENVMIVDLVRNDLARSSQPGSVQVEELFGIYPFPLVHQMISTVSSRLRPELSGLEALKAAFPMGSMTGAPKIMAMQLIDRYELARRGVYSGAIGYFTPEDDFDFNVVIRTLVYDAAQRYISLQVGSAITYDSVPEKEYEECFVKIKGWLKVLGGK